MSTKLRKHFGIPGILAIAALVFAMIGGAYAASDPGGGKATSSAKRGKPGKPGKRGPTGPTGPTGAPGAQGAQGPAGAKGDKGDAGAQGGQGEQGDPGDPGDPGKSVVVGSFTKEDEELGDPPLEPCDLQGGLEVEEEGSGTPEIVCNGAQGEDGEPGPPGQPWTPDNTLPPGATLTGTWSFNGTTADGGVSSEVDGPTAYASISFPIKLAAGLGEAKVHFQGEPGFATSCPAGSTNNPTAVEGHLCVYVTGLNLINAVPAFIFEFAKPFVTPGGEFGEASPAGATLVFKVTGNPASGFGSWAVTGFDPTP